MDHPRDKADHRADSLVEVNVGPLCEAAQNPTSFIPLQSPISLKLVFEDPLAKDHISPMWAWDKVSSVVLQEGSVFLLHSGPPIRIGKGTTKGLVHRRERRAW